MAQKVVKRKSSTKGRTITSRGLAERVAAVEGTVSNSVWPTFRMGDTLKVHVRIKEGDKERLQLFEGVAIARSGSGIRRSTTVRKISHGVGVERVFVESSPKVAKVEVARPGKVRQAKLYYLRALEGRAAKIDRRLDK